MSLDHIIPRFILKGYALNPTAPANEQEIKILDKETKECSVEKIKTAYAIKDFNSEKTERLLCEEYENKVARIFHRIKKRADSNEEYVDLSQNEYKLLFRFFVVMWRRNDIQIKKGIELLSKINDFMKSFFGDNLQNMLKQEYKNVNINELIKTELNKNKKILYDSIISQTDDSDPTVKKTILHYKPCIIYNKSNINFTMHNTYGTVRYMVESGHIPNETDTPNCFIEPISNKLCFLLNRTDTEISLENKIYKIPIEVISDDAYIKEYFIEGYIIKQATSFVVDNTNLEIIKSKISEN